ncbi:MAG: hypothetical protein LBO06_05295 [Bacteroidales bacterium]|jgi:dsDNA-specific endonuclease/ATPase MutS2|nr:hypothetical protein [Bacteroidales bacterium]
MTFIQACKSHDGLALLANELSFSSNLGRQKLNSTKFSTHPAWLINQFALANDVLAYQSKDSNRRNLKAIRQILHSIHDIKPTVNLLNEKAVLDDVSLFEIKALAIQVKKIKSLMTDLTNPNLQLPNLNSVITILDPEGMETMQFYIYSSYSSVLAELRKEIANAKFQSDNSVNQNTDSSFEQLYIKASAIENKIRASLSAQLRDYVEDLLLALDVLAELDLTLAKADLYLKWQMNQPTISTDKVLEYNDLSYPPIAQRLQQSGKTFQPISITIDQLPILITGANMSGKSILLKSLSFAQLSVQFGFFVAAKRATVSLVEGVMMSIGDNQDDNSGLSSFASEILSINQMICKAKTKKRYLILVDELARTTNPYEGTALLKGCLNVLAQQNSLCVITTHYSVTQVVCKKLRVKGFVHQDLIPPLCIEQISERIDYSLTSDDSDKVPTEAINLAKLLSIDPDWLSESLK